MIAGQSYSYWCNSTGGRPPPSITWTLDSQSLSAVTLTSQDSLYISSQLVYTASVNDNGKTLTVTVDHQNTSTNQANTWLMVVHGTVQLETLTFTISKINYTNSLKIKSFHMKMKTYRENHIICSWKCEI